jgi:type II secretory pathway pseudopilin PulG
MRSVKDSLLAVVKDRRRRQAGTTLIELLVSLTIAGLSLALIIGTFSTGLLDAALAKRNTAAQAVIEYEKAQVGASVYSGSAPSYSDCFATEQPVNPTPATAYLGSCPAGYPLRADVGRGPYPGSSSVQLWTISVSGTSGPTSDALQILKVPYQ